MQKKIDVIQVRDILKLKKTRLTYPSNYLIIMVASFINPLSEQQTLTISTDKNFVNFSLVQQRARNDHFPNT